MKFFDWLFGRENAHPANETETQVDLPDDKLFTEVNKWTRAGKQGKVIFCPKCGDETLVHHFAWSTLKCTNCKKFVEKYEWLVPTGVWR